MSQAHPETPQRVADLARRDWTTKLADCYAKLDPSTPLDYRALATLLASEWSSDPPKRIGLAGGQGAGKSTLSRLIEAACASFGVRVCVLGLDDFYFSRAHRKSLAEEIHPLLETRGPPGTHDISRCRDAISQLLLSGEVELPVFDKGLDDLAGVRRVRGPFDLILLEGWCVGALSVDEASLAEPINPLEASQDGEGRWRRYVNRRLAGAYAATWDELEDIVYLRVPNLEAVRRWRLQQERSRPEDRRIGSEAVDAFVQHFERVTLSMMETLAEHANPRVDLAEDHSISSVVFRSSD